MVTWLDYKQQVKFLGLKYMKHMDLDTDRIPNTCQRRRPREMNRRREWMKARS